MKNHLVSALRLSALAATLLVLPALASATDQPADPAATLLMVSGSVPVKNAGPFVEVGTYRIQVSVKLGQPSARLADGTWLYASHRIDDGDATGTLVVRFNRGRVSDLALVTNRSALAMIQADHNATPKAVAALSRK